MELLLFTEFGIFLDRGPLAVCGRPESVTMRTSLGEVYMSGDWRYADELGSDPSGVSLRLGDVVVAW